jgi:uncharacterized protein (DUF302 family)
MAIETLKERNMSTGSNGIVHLTSARSVSDVLEHLLAILRAKSVTVFAVIDHSGEAARVDIKMNDTKLVIFGNPKAGTPLMLASPDSALDLPLKILIAEDSDGRTRVSYNSLEFFQERFGLTPELINNIAAIEQIAAATAG